MKKRGQATAFIIIVIVILIIAAIFLGMRYAVSQGLFKSFFTKEEVLPAQIRPIQESLSSCALSLLEQGAQRLALQGGHLNLENDNIPTTPFTPLQRNLEIIPDTDIETVVWFREQGNGITEMNMPSQTQMEEDIAQYINSNLRDCAFNLTHFLDEGYLLSTRGKTPETQVTIEEEQIQVRVNFPLDITKSGQTFTLESFGGTKDISLGKLYKQAREIFEKENEELFLEQKTIDTLVAYNDEVPFSGTDTSCSPKLWSKTEVTTKLKNILFENVAAFSVQGTGNEIQEERFNYLSFDALDKKDNQLAVNFMYIPTWPTLVEVLPSEGDIMKGDAITKEAGGVANAILSQFFCLNNYHFVYDIKYPILITLRDEETDFIFQFATQVIIDNNQPRINQFETLDIVETESPICEYKTAPLTIMTKTVTPSGSLINLPEAGLSLKCFPAACPLGTSNAQGLLNTISPPCVNGILEATKEGYHSGKTLLSTNEGAAVAEIVLEPFYEKEVVIKLREKDSGKIRDPYDSETVFIQFNHQLTTYTTSYQYPDEESNTLQLLIGPYDINAMVFGSSTWPITLPQETITKCVDTRASGLLGLFKTEKKCIDTTTEKIELEQALKGGMNFVYEFQRAELSREGKLTIYILVDKLPSSLDTMNQIQLSLETNKDHPYFMNPKIQ